MSKGQQAPTTGGAAARDPASQHAADLAPGMKVQSVFVVKKRVCREQPGGGKFLLFQFADKSGSINGVMWDGAEAAARDIAAGDLAQVQGEVHRGRRGLVGKSILGRLARRGGGLQGRAAGGRRHRRHRGRPSGQGFPGRPEVKLSTDLAQTKLGDIFPVTARTA
jgi:DNA polymerase III alpha subunit